MAMPDIGLSPPPPVDVSSQMRPAAGAPGGAPDLASILQKLAGNAPPSPQPDMTDKVLQVEPYLTQIARQVPALGPDVDRLNIELKARMGGLPQGLGQMAGNPAPPLPPPPAGASTGGPPPVAGPGSIPPGPAPAPQGPPPGNTPLGPGPGAIPQAPPPQAAAAPQTPPPPMQPPPSAQPVDKMGAMDTAMQLEVQLPPLGKEDPTLMPYIQGFIARMRTEVPRVVDGETEPVSPPVQKAPTESMLSKIPVSY